MQQTFIRIISCCHRFVEDPSTWTAKSNYKKWLQKVFARAIILQSNVCSPVCFIFAVSIFCNYVTSYRREEDIWKKRKTRKTVARVNYSFYSSIVQLIRTKVKTKLHSLWIRS